MTTIADLQAWQRVVGASEDGKPGPDTFARTVGWFRDHGFIKPDELPDGARERVVFEARAGVGMWTEADVDGLWREVGCPEFVGHWHDKAWCGGYALRCLRRVLGINWTWKNGIGFAEPHGMPRVTLPEPGDIAYFAKNSHYAIVADVGSGNVQLVNGNGLTAPLEGVTETSRPLLAAAGGPSTYYSIRNLVPA
jgi:hypothetical protein